ncbi:hypothetical protein DM01DRAFT_1331301 [Hesseltinella vesiculosa]|uniref:Uncharacterized protein n=1 Tax=Hesseltinella vesiculosa TaxID=101127 RepID=A0A1X2GYQ7_9FUNG|nr:hypothetical protein DM01DRAFT_1331301 [Hesseltinella vesiculosa]
MKTLESHKVNKPFFSNKGLASSKWQPCFYCGNKWFQGHRCAEGAAMLAAKRQIRMAHLKKKQGQRADPR